MRIETIKKGPDGQPLNRAHVGVRGGSHTPPSGWKISGEPEELPTNDQLTESLNRSTPKYQTVIANELKEKIELYIGNVALGKMREICNLAELLDRYSLDGKQTVCAALEKLAAKGKQEPAPRDVIRIVHFFEGLAISGLAYLDQLPLSLYQQIYAVHGQSHDIPQLNEEAIAGFRNRLEELGIKT